MSSQSKRDFSTGRFVRTVFPWSPDNFESGFVRDGRFIVYLPDHPRAQKGYIFRAIAVYEAVTGEKITKDFCIHHIDENKLNDSFENLEKLPFGFHTSLHNESRKNGENRSCLVCGKTFYIPKWRLNTGRAGKFCSKECRNARGELI